MKGQTMLTILQYQGISVMSRIIRNFTRSKWSHSAVMMRDGCVIEAWYKGGVSRVPSVYTNHTEGTIIDVYSIKCSEEQERMFETFLTAQVGLKYDFRMVLRFLTRKKSDPNGKWFCSELVTAALIHAGVLPKLPIDPAEISPKELGTILSILTT